MPNQGMEPAANQRTSDRELITPAVCAAAHPDVGRFRVAGVIMMLKSSTLPKLIFLLTALPFLQPSPASAASLMPLEKGASWVYEGRVEWQHGVMVERKRISLTTEIVEVFDYPKARVAVVRGFPTDLAWYGDKPHPSYSLLIVTRTNAYHRRADSEEAAYRLAREFSQDSDGQLQFADSILSYPPSRCKRSRFHIKGFSPRKRVKCERSVYRTNPDIEVIDFAHGLGIIRYYYKHFGTVSLADVELKEVRFPRKSRSRRELGYTRPVPNNGSTRPRIASPSSAKLASIPRLVAAGDAGGWMASIYETKIIIPANVPHEGYLSWSVDSTFWHGSLDAVPWYV